MKAGRNGHFTVHSHDSTLYGLGLPGANLNVVGLIYAENAVVDSVIHRSVDQSKCVG